MCDTERDTKTYDIKDVQVAIGMCATKIQNRVIVIAPLLGARLIKMLRQKYEYSIY